MTERIAIIAGAGEFPVVMAREFVARGVETVAIAIQEEADRAIEAVATRTYWQPLGKVGKLLKALRKEEVRRAVLAGKVHKTHIFRDFRPDLRALALLWGLKDRGDDTILHKVADVLAEEGVELIAQTTHMEAYLPAAQVFTRRKPSAGEQADVVYGARLAREMGRLDIGQTVVVKRGAVLAVEAIEGTDQAIRRGGSLGSGGVVVVKVAKPDQDLRFDVPAIGLDTVLACRDAGAKLLAIEAGSTFFFQQQEAIALADRSEMCLLAFEGAGADPTEG